MAAHLDSHALLCLGWLQVEQAEETQNDELLQRGLTNIKIALKQWAYNPLNREWESYASYQSCTMTAEKHWEEHLRKLAKGRHYETLGRIAAFALSNKRF